MISNKYLTDENIDFYSEALEHAKNCNDDFWSLDSDLHSHLEKINKNPKVRTLYSKNGTGDFYDGLSYLHFCYSKEIEFEIENNFIPQLKSEFGNELTILKKEPELGTENPDKKHPCLKFTHNPEYRNVWNYEIHLKSKSSKSHLKFWSQLSSKMSNLGNTIES